MEERDIATQYINIKYLFIIWPSHGLWFSNIYWITCIFYLTLGYTADLADKEYFRWQETKLEEPDTRICSVIFSDCVYAYLFVLDEVNYQRCLNSLNCYLLARH